MVKRLETAEFARLLGLSQSEDGSWLEDIRAIAGMVRKSVYRRGVATRQEVWNDWRSSFEALGEDRANIKNSILDVADRLAAIGDLVSVKVGNEHGWVKPKPRWIALTENQGVLVGGFSRRVEKEAKLLIMKSNADVVRRFSLKDDSSDGIYLEAEELRLNNWIGRGDWWQFVNDSEHSPKSNNINEFWKIQLARLSKSQIRSDSNSNFTFVLAGDGGYFGSTRSEEAKGRWRTPGNADNGFYVGRLRGFNENDWRFFFCEVAELAITNIVSLSSLDEAIWTQIAKGVTNQSEEKWTIKDDIISFEFPPPRQLARLCDLLGWRVGAWKWQLAECETEKLLRFWKDF